MLHAFNEMNRDLLVNINGELQHREEAGVSPFDSAVQAGDAVWESLRLYQGSIFKLTEHLGRLRSGASSLAFTDIPTPEDIIHEIRQTLDANNMWDSVYIRLTLTRGIKLTSGTDPRLNAHGSTLIVLAEHKPPASANTGLRLITATHRCPDPDSIDSSIRHINSIHDVLAKVQANAAGVDDAVMLDSRGFVTRTNTAHLFIVTDGKVLTPRTHACHGGITRSAILGICEQNGIPHAECDLSLAQVCQSDEVFCADTMNELSAVNEVDGTTIGHGEVGPVTLRLSNLFRSITTTSGTVVVDRKSTA